MTAEPHHTFDRVSEALDRLADVAPERWAEALAELPSERERALVLRLAEQELLTRDPDDTTLPQGSSTGSRDSSDSGGSVAEQFPDLVQSWPEDGEFAPYELLRRVGEGGMGQVYEALRIGEGFRQRVALKVLAGALAGARAEERFVRESEVLANLEHPGIARFIDAGRSRRGTLFYAMEFVEGEEITGACDRLRLGLRERVEVFLQVCDAVAAAHRHLVLHRDLKPGNVLMTDARVVKLVDFGIAKLLDSEQGDQTVGRAFTPGYAAPEQMLGRATSTATDVYCLGLILFELLVGVRARRWRGESDEGPLAEGREPGPMPGTREWTRLWSSREAGEVGEIEQSRGANRRQIETFVRGDLGNILRRALEWEPGERYASVDALTADLRALLEDRPVSATRSTFGYVAGRLLRRHRTTALVGGLGLALTLVGAIGTVWQGVRAQQERDRVVRANQEIGAVSDFLVRDLLGAFSPDTAQNRQVTLAELADSAAASLESRPDTPPPVRRRLHLRLAELYLDLGEDDAAARQLEAAESVPAGKGEPPASVSRLRGRLLLATGELDRAEEEIAAALEELSASQSGDQRHLARSELELLGARLTGQRGNWSTAEQRVRGVLAQLDTDDTGDPDDPPIGDAMQRLSLEARGLLVELLGSQLKAAEALEVAEQLLEDQRRILGEGHPDLVATWNVLARSYDRASRFDEALAASRAAILLAERVFGEDHPRTLTSLNYLGWAQISTQEFDRVLETYRDMEARATRSLGPDHHTTITAMMNRGVVMARMGDAAGAIDIYQRAVGRFRASLGEDHPSTQRAQRNLMSSLRREGRDEEADRVVEDLIRAGHRHARSDEADPYRTTQFADYLGLRFPERFRDLDTALRYARQVYDATNGEDYGPIVILARLQHASGRTAEALELLTVASGLPDAVFTYSLERNIIDFAIDHGDPDRGLVLLRRIQERRRQERVADDPIHGVSLRRISELLRRASRLEEAGEEASASLEFYLGCCGADSLETALGHMQLARVLIDQERFDEARAELDLAAQIQDNNSRTSSADRNDLKLVVDVFEERVGESGEGQSE